MAAAVALYCLSGLALLSGALFASGVGLRAFLHARGLSGVPSLTLIFLAAILCAPLLTLAYGAVCLTVGWCSSFSPWNTAVLLTMPMAVSLAPAVGLSFPDWFSRGRSVGILALGVLQWAALFGSVYYSLLPAQRENPGTLFLLGAPVLVWLSGIVGLRELSGPRRVSHLTPTQERRAVRVRALLGVVMVFGAVVVLLHQIGSLHPWDIEVAQLSTLELKGSELKAIAWSPDGELLAAITSLAPITIEVWRVHDGSILRSFAVSRYSQRAIAWGPDGQTLAVAGDNGTVALWRVADGTPLRTLPMRRIDPGEDDDVLSVNFSPDGQLLAAGVRDYTVRLWRVADGAPIQSLAGHTAQVNVVEFSPDGSLLASGSSDGTVRLWRVPEGVLERTIDAHSGSVGDIAFSSDGQTLASGGTDKRRFATWTTMGAVKLWRVANGAKLLAGDADSHMVRTVAVHPDGHVVASSGYNRAVRLWRVEDGAMREIANVASQTLAFRSNGQALATGHATVSRGQIRLWRLER